MKETLSRLNVEIRSEANSDIESLIQFLEKQESLCSFIHRDPIPPIFIRRDETLRILDLEFSGYGDVLTDAMNFRMSFPTYGLPGRFPADLVQTLKGGYHATLQERLPRLEDDEFFNEVSAKACAWWLMELSRSLDRTTTTDPPPPDEMNTISDRRQWVWTRLHAFVASTEHGHTFSGLRSLSLNLIDRLTDLWERDASEIDFYPAFGTSSIA